MHNIRWWYEADKVSGNMVNGGASGQPLSLSLSVSAHITTDRTYGALVEGERVFDLLRPDRHGDIATKFMVIYDL